jgi:hypothetical protein
MYVALGIEVISTILEWDQVVAQIPSYQGAVALGTILSFATDIWFIWLVARRRKNWTRWVMLLGFVFEIPFTLPWLLSLTDFNSVLICMTWLAQIVAFMLIFTGNAREWFANDPVRQFSPAN